MIEGNIRTAKILFVSDYMRNDEAAFHTILSDQRRSILVGALNRAGIPEADYAFTIIFPFETSSEGLVKESQDKKTLALMNCKKVINDLKPNVIVPLGEMALKYITGLEKIQNHKCTVLKAKAEFGGIKTIPLLHPEHIQKVWEDHAYMSFGCSRLKSEYHSKETRQDSRCFRLSLDLSFSQIMKELDVIEFGSNEISLDFETGRSQINTLGIARDDQNAIAIECLPDKWNIIEFHQLWKKVRDILENPRIKKVCQNAMHESQFCSLYGIELKGISFDTMVAFKMLHPNLEMGLDNICRLYTDLPYWKDEGKDWNDVRNWRDHLLYNCKDTTSTFQAKTNLEIALKERSLWEQYETYIASLYPAMQDMSNAGILISKERLEDAKAEVNKELTHLKESFNAETKERFGLEINPNSPKQVKSLFREAKIKIPTKMGKETVGKDALKKLTKTYPKEALIPALIKISDLTNELETYYNFDYDEDNRLRFSSSMFHNEFGEFKTSENPFGKGFDLSGLYKKTKSFLMADEGKEFLEVSFWKAEQTYLAYDSGDQKMISMIRDGKDIPEMLATRMFNKAFPHPYSPEYRIAESAIYAAAYGMSPRAFSIQTSATIRGISDNDAKKYISIIFEFFPKLKQRQERIQSKLRSDRTLKNLIGSTATFYDRLNDDLFKRAYEWGYRSLMSDLIKQLSVHIRPNLIKAITNDSVLIQEESLEIFQDIDWIDARLWHPELKTLTGSFKFQPVCKKGTTWGNLERI